MGDGVDSLEDFAGAADPAPGAEGADGREVGVGGGISGFVQGHCFVSFVPPFFRV